MGKVRTATKAPVCQQAVDVPPLEQPGRHRQEQRDEGAQHRGVEPGRVEHRPVAGHLRCGLVVGEDEDATDDQRQLEQLTGDHRRREREDGAERQTHAAGTHVLEQPAFAQDAHQDRHRHGQPDDAGGHVPDREELHRGPGDGQCQHDTQPQGRGEQELAEEDRARRAEHGEDGDEDLVEGFQRSEDDQDEHDLLGRRVVNVQQLAGEQEDQAQADEAGDHDRPDRENHGTEHPVVVPVLLVLGHEPAEQPALSQ
jgi:hypothetical protein